MINLAFRSNRRLSSVAKRLLIGTAAIIACSQTGASVAQADAPVTAPVTAKWYNKVQFSGLIDTYISINPNAPAGDNNQLQNWTFKANQFALPLVELGITAPTSAMARPRPAMTPAMMP